MFIFLWSISVFIFLLSISMFIFLYSTSVLYSNGASVCYILMGQQCVVL